MVRNKVGKDNFYTSYFDAIIQLNHVNKSALKINSNNKTAALHT
jgi:hypothetical protein